MQQNILQHFKKMNETSIKQGKTGVINQLKAVNLVTRVINQFNVVTVVTIIGLSYYMNTE